MRADTIRNRYHLAYLYYKRGDWERAKDTLARALDLTEHGYWRGVAVTLMKELHQEVA
jgi:uncharacterized protein HemY